METTTPRVWTFCGKADTLLRKTESSITRGGNNHAALVPILRQQCDKWRGLMLSIISEFIEPNAQLQKAVQTAIELLKTTIASIELSVPENRKQEFLTMQRIFQGLTQQYQAMNTISQKQQQPSPSSNQGTLPPPISCPSNESSSAASASNAQVLSQRAEEKHVSPSLPASPAAPPATSSNVSQLSNQGADSTSGINKVTQDLATLSSSDAAFLQNALLPKAPTAPDGKSQPLPKDSSDTNNPVTVTTRASSSKRPISDSSASVPSPSKLAIFGVNSEEADLNITDDEESKMKSNSKSASDTQLPHGWTRSRDMISNSLPAHMQWLLRNHPVVLKYDDATSWMGSYHTRTVSSFRKLTATETMNSVRARSGHYLVSYLPLKIKLAQIGAPPPQAENQMFMVHPTDVASILASNPEGKELVISTHPSIEPPTWHPPRDTINASDCVDGANPQVIVIDDDALAPAEVTTPIKKKTRRF